MGEYNLIDEKWIPVRWLDGTLSEVSISDALLQGKEIAMIDDQSPLVVASLYRFLLSILYRALQGPTNIQKAKELFKAGLPNEQIKDYLSNWHCRFYLFDENYPFAQIKYESNKWKPWTTLTAEHNADNAKVLFDHTSTRQPGKISKAKTARSLLATHTFALSAGRSDTSHTFTAPSATGVMILPIGNNLEETLILSLVCQDKQIFELDVPHWENSKTETIESLKTEVKNINGFSQLYSWLSRSIYIEKGNEIETLLFASGVQFHKLHLEDPMCAYKTSKKSGKSLIQFEENKGLWRNFDALLPENIHCEKENSYRQVFEHALILTRNSEPAKAPKFFLVLGQSTDKATINFWRKEMFIFPNKLLNKYTKANIENLLKYTEKFEEILSDSCRVFNKIIFNSTPSKSSEKHMRDIYISNYWSKLEMEFHSTLFKFENEIKFEIIEKEWIVEIEKILKFSWDLIKSTINLSVPKELKAFISADEHLHKMLAKLKKTYDLRE